MHALEMALEALTNPSTIAVQHAIELIQAELAKPEQTPFKPDWVGYRQGVADGAAQLAQPEQDHGFDRTASHMTGEYVDTAQPEQEPVSIGIDVTPEGTHVVACYNKPNSVREMFYSEFHPMNKTDKPKSMSWEEWESIVYEKMKRQYQWQGLTDDEKNNCLVEADPCEALATPEAQELMREVEAKLKEKNGAL